ncbi:MAG TPA: hypothetical protein VGM91_10840 [Conexibacter sp.]
MTASTAPLDSPAWLATLRARVTPAPVAAERATSGRVYWAIAAVSIIIAAFTLLYPSTPTYDPWAWIIWGREIVHFNLQTTGGPSWKPLSVAFTTLFAPFGSVAPDLWLTVARAGAVMSIIMSFRLAGRLTGGSVPARLIAGVIAGMALIISSQFVRNMTLGNSEGLLVALGLWGIERHLDGKYRQAFVLGFLCALLRPEIWPFLAVYGVWLIVLDTSRKEILFVAGTGVLILALWLLPEYWGSGDLWRAADRAQDPSPNSPAFAKFPFWQVLKNTWPLILTPIKAASAFGFLVACWNWWRARRDVAVITLTVLSVLWICLIALMTQAGFSGNPRYIILATTVIAVIGGVGFGRAVDIAGAVVGRFSAERNGRVLAIGAGLLAGVVLLGATYHWAGPRFRSFGNLDRALRYQAELRIDLSNSLDKVGGKKLAQCGPVTTGTYQVPMVAWYLGLHTLQVGLDIQPRGVIVASRSTGAAPLAPEAPYPPGYEKLVAQRSTTLFSTCPPSGGA